MMKRMQNDTPPRLALAFLHWFCAPKWVEEIEGDLEEQFHLRREQQSLFWARLLYWKDMLLFVRPYTLRRSPSYEQALGPIMIGHYVKVATRNMWKQKLYAFINVFGLAVGLAVCILLFLYVRHEWSYDRFHEKQEQIYRVTRNTETPKEVRRTAVVSAPLATTLKEEIPEIEKAVRLTYEGVVVNRGTQTFSQNALFADSSFLTVFTFPLVQGHPAQALHNLNGVVLTEALAEKYFGDQPALGEHLSIKLAGVFHDFEVTGVVGEMPGPSSIQFNLVLPYEWVGVLNGREVFTDWRHTFTSTFVQLPAGVQPEQLAASLHAFAQVKYKELEEGLRARGILDDRPDPITLGLQPLAAVHTDTAIEGTLEVTGVPLFTQLLAGMALFILLIACLNFVNLAIARASTRIREIGVRKVVGAVRGQLMRQFWGEAVLLSGGALLIALLLVVLCLPVFSTLAGQPLALDLHSNWVTAVALVGVSLLVGLIAGCYPAAYLSHFRPVEVLKGTMQKRGKRRLSKALVVFQFTLSVILIVGTLLLSKQVDYLRGKDLGFDAEHVVAIPTQSEEGQTVLDKYREALSAHPEVMQVTGGSTPMSDWWSRMNVEIGDEQFQTFHIRGDYAFLETFDIELAAGRDFSPDLVTDEVSAVLINESFARRVGWEEPLNKTFTFMGTSVTVVGVVKDFHFISLHYPVGPLILHLQPRNLRYIFARIQGPDVASTLALLESTWRTLTPELPFTYRFLDERIAQQYETEERITTMVRYAAFLAILIACLGLFGLSALMAAQRTKEIGIRKVLGASVPGLVQSLTKEFVVLVVVANVIAWPIAYLSVDQLFQFHAYRTPIGVEYFLLTGIVSVTIALLSVSYQSIKTALTNPTQTLRYE